jgi:hypothetical protein
MQQRQPRLGDIVDDYCPRERRITNHAVVAMVGDEVRQTRCTTCESEHQFKQARVPPQRRKKDPTGALYQQVLDGMPRKVVPAGLDAPPDTSDVDAPSDTSDDTALMVESESEVIAGEPVEAPPAVAVGDDVDGPVHRPLIRATLPRLTDDPPQRREPDFTMRGPAHRPGKFSKNGFRGHRPGGHGGHQQNGNRQGTGNHDASGNRAPGGKRHSHGPHRPGGGRPGQSPHGTGRGPRPGGHGRGGKKSPR